MAKLNFVKREIIHKGWSKDQKYCVTDEKGGKYLLRISPADQFEQKKFEFEMMEKIAALHVPMCKPIKFGTCDEGVYSIQSWVEGQDAQEVIPTVSDTEAYVYGLHAGRWLKQIHTIPAPTNQPDWEMRFNKKMDRNIKNYIACPIKHKGGDALIKYINEHRHLLKDRPQTYQHGDYHIGNMMIGSDGELSIIDFNRNDYGDPWEEFNRIVWCAQSSPLFASGMVNGYFDSKVPMAFWQLLALYTASNALSSIPWAIPFGKEEVDVMLNQGRDILTWYDGMKNPVPTWYFSYYLQAMDGIPYKLKRAFDFSFISKYGKVFKVFDDQDSGNICFGAEKEGERYFVKFAGAPTEQYNGSPHDAIALLKAAVPIYQDLHHNNLIPLISSENIGQGFAAVFQWVDGECMGKMYPASSKKFMALPLVAKIKVFKDIVIFFEHAASQSYVAIDFYDGSIMYDFAKEKTIICDIDCFQKRPYKNHMGRMWGSTRFLSPEEYQLGADINEITNVYTLGATAFALFANANRTKEKWPLDDTLYAIFTKAASPDPMDRHQSIKQLIADLKDASF